MSRDNVTVRGRDVEQILDQVEVQYELDSKFERASTAELIQGPKWHLLDLRIRSFDTDFFATTTSLPSQALFFSLMVL